MEKKLVNNLTGHQKIANHIKFSPRSAALQSPLGMSRNTVLPREVRDKATTAAKWTCYFLINLNDLNWRMLVHFFLNMQKKGIFL